MVIRILVTGSRDWTDRAAVWKAIESYLVERGHIDEQDMPIGPVIIVHGGCRTGADRIAYDWAILHGMIEETWAADWTHEYAAGGPRRNARMVKAGADVCIAFPNMCRIRRCQRYGGRPHWTHGTDDCATRARGAGIEVRVCSPS